MQCVSQWSDVNWEPGQHFDIGAVDVVVVIDGEGTAVIVVVEAVEAVEVEK